MELSKRIVDRAHALGFDLAGITPATPVPHLAAYRAWIAQGYHGQMGYMARPDRVERRENPAAILDGVRSVVCAGLNYAPAPQTRRDDPSRGRIASYAWGQDYHALMLPRLEALAAFIQQESGSAVRHRAYVDTGPILERAYAARAGLGFIGKNSNLIHPRMGSWLFLGELLVDIELQSTPNEIKADCGACRRCIDACPTGALVAPHVLDARRCIAYLTIELKGTIPPQLRPRMGNWIYGCDVCQAVCPWQRFATPTQEQAFQPAAPARAAPRLLTLAQMDERAFQQRYARSPMLRTGRERLMRNVAIALGNWGNDQAIRALRDLLTDPAPLVRDHAAWALGRV